MSPRQPYQSLQPHQDRWQSRPRRKSCPLRTKQVWGNPTLISHAAPVDQIEGVLLRWPGEGKELSTVPAGGLGRGGSPELAQALLITLESLDAGCRLHIPTVLRGCLCGSGAVGLSLASTSNIPLSRFSGFTLCQAQCSPCDSPHRNLNSIGVQCAFHPTDAAAEASG